jgi:hypothetical protein
MSAVEELIPSDVHNESYVSPGLRPHTESAHHGEPAVQQVIGIRPSTDAIEEVHVKTAPGYCSVLNII